MSKSYLSRVFKECTGYTVNEYINVNRIQQARKLLAETPLPVSDIASSLGYESVTYFERCSANTRKLPLSNTAANT